MTKLHKTATAFLLTAALLLSGCAEQGNSPAQEPESTSSDSNFSNSADNSGYSITEDSENSSDTQSFKDSLLFDSFVAPDGSIVYSSEAVDAEYDPKDNTVSLAGFDFTLIRYASPVFRSTIEEPDLVDWEKGLDEFIDKYAVDLEDTVYFKIKPGDKLDNGLTVKSAKYWVDPRGSACATDVEFDGDLTLTGILCCTKANEDRGIPSGNLSFYPDLTKFDSIPIIVPIPIGDGDYIRTYADKKDLFALVYDSAKINFGNINDLDIDLSDMISPGENKKIKVTINNLYSRYWPGPNRYMSAEIISAEPIT